MQRALIAMSGGVDSSVAAYLMKKSGFDCAGCTMKLYENEDAGIPRAHTCCALDDVEDARAVAYRLSMPYHVFNFMDDFFRCVMEKFARCYTEGRTPNPCIDCNRYLKFDRLLHRAQVLGFDLVATGHYARIERIGEKFVLKKALDRSKDQSYVLYMLGQEQLRRLCFPLGTLEKNQVRMIAQAQGFVNAHKPDSQDICFVPDGDYAAAVERISGQSCPSGVFADAAGTVLGRHRGITHYTIGQRRGLGIADAQPYYVTAIRPESNTVVLGRAHDLLQKEADVADFHLISGEAVSEPFDCTAKIRYRQPEQPVTVIPTGPETVRLVFREPQRAVTSGQSAVLYDGEIVLGGGTIV